MNASALLQSQGWRGEGHTLHATSDSIGLKNRLLVGRKANTSGLGASEYANDQWWLSALDEQLGGLSTKNGKIVQTVKDGKLDRLNDNVGKSELYKFFVSGGTLQGTVDKLPSATRDGAASRDKPALKTRVVTLAASAKQSETESTSSSSESSKRKESKEERRERKAARQERREQKRARREARKQKTRSTSSTDADEGTDGARSAKTETKEARRARKEARRKRKEEKRRSRR